MHDTRPSGLLQEVYAEQRYFNRPSMRLSHSPAQPQRPSPRLPTHPPTHPDTHTNSITIKLFGSWFDPCLSSPSSAYAGEFLYCPGPQPNVASPVCSSVRP